MPYDPTPVGPDVLPDGTRETLTVQIAGGRSTAPGAFGAGEPETGLVLDRPAAGRVAVREFPRPGAPLAYDARVEDVLARVEGALAAGRRASAAPHAVRQGLAGRG
jgi:hypothetical protein